MSTGVGLIRAGREGGIVRRIAILGSPGSGKSTVSRQLGAITGIPVVHLDKLYWKPGWVEPARHQWATLQEELVQRDAWIIDGNYGGTAHIRIQSADTIIFLDPPRWVCLYRAIKRALQYRGKTRSDMGQDCPEKVDGEFLRYIWRFRSQQRPQLLKRLEAVQHEKMVVVLRTGRDVRQYLAELSVREHST